MYRGCWPVHDVIHSCLKNLSREYRRKQHLLDAEVKIADLEEEADELGRYIGKRKAVEGSRRRAAADGSGSGRRKGAGKKSKK